MSGGTISGNTSQNGTGGGVAIQDEGVFVMEGGTIYGKADSLPSGTDASLANSAPERTSSLKVWKGTAKWGSGGTYTTGGVPQSGGSDIVRPIPNHSSSTDDTLIAVPAK
jgi:hypothetical protein